MLVFEERGKPEYPEKNLSEQSREPNKITGEINTNLAHDSWYDVTAHSRTNPLSGAVSRSTWLGMAEVGTLNLDFWFESAEIEKFFLGRLFMRYGIAKTIRTL